MMIRLGSLVAVVLLMTGCSGIEPKPFAPTARVGSVALLEVPQFDDYRIDNLSATMLGVAATKMSHQGKLQEAINSTGFDFKKEFTSELESALMKIGVRVETIDTKRSSLKLLDSYDKVQTQAQAILDVVPTPYVGFSTETPAGRTDYRPTMALLKVVLVDSDTNEVLYSELFEYGSKNSLISGTEIDPPESTFYKTADELVADDNAMQSLRVALKHASEIIAERIKNGNDKVTN